jgi:hypothetical protein
MSGYCKYCDSLTNKTVQVFDKGVLIWSGCVDCYEKRNELKHNDRLSQ